MLNVTLFTKKDCPPCDQLKADLNELQAQYPHRLVEVQIESDAAIQEKYKDIVPVIEVGPYVLQAPISRQKLQISLGAASDRKTQLETLNDPIYNYKMKKGKNLTSGDRVSFWIAKRYLLILNLFILLYAGLPLLAPTFMKIGWVAPANVIYRIYKPLCHQFGFRSFFLYGEQPFYPTAETGMTGYKTFEQVTGITGVEDPYSASRFEARNYIGNETVGFKAALCERDLGIYFAMLAFGVIFSLTGRKLKTLPWMLWLLLAIAPVGFDGFSQLFSQFNWDWLSALLPYRESTPYLRVLTGAMFGFFTAWFAYPNIEDSMKETRQYYIKKSAVIEASE
ncbi:hypothetical protein MASR2M66_30360 [Chloroflexota bacterium]